MLSFYFLFSKKEDENLHTNEQQEGREESVPKRKFKKRKMKIRKLKLGDKLSLKEKEHLKLKRVDRRLGLKRFRLAGKMMKKIRWRKNSQKANSRDKSSSKEIKQQQKDEQSIKEDNNNDNNAQQQQQQQQQQQENSGEQQYEDEETEDNGRDQEDETSSSNLYEGISNAAALYHPILNPISTGYMTTGFNNMMDLYPPPSPVTPTTASDRRDLKKKYKKSKKSKKSKKLESVKSEEEGDLKEDNSKAVEEEEKLDQNEEVDNNDEKDNLKLNTNKSESIKSINHFETASSNLINNKIIQPIFTPIFTPDDRQLTPSSLYSLLALTSNARQRLSMPHLKNLNNLNPHYSHHQHTLPLFAPTTKSSLDNSAALLLPLIAHQSHQQQQLIIAQHQKLLEQEAKQNELKEQLEQANLESSSQHEKQRQEIVAQANDSPLKNEKYYEDSINEKLKGKARSKLLYANELDWNKIDDKFTRSNRYDKASINRLRRRKFDQQQSNQSKRLMNQLRNDEFNFSDFDDEEARSPSNSRGLRKQSKQMISKRMYDESEEAELKSNVTKSEINMSNSSKNTDYKASTINKIKLDSNASLTVYGY